MKIGILTLPSHANYGGILQAYALQTVLERHGHEVVIFHTNVDGVRKIPPTIYPLVLIKRLLKKIFVDHSTVVFLELKKRKEFSVLTKNNDAFISKYIHVYHVKNLKAIPQANYDAIVVGSDQIWRSEYVRDMWKTGIQDAFLRFALGWKIKRVAYAASFGVDEWLLSSKKTSECKALAQLFDDVSVREASAVKLCSDILGVNAKLVLDPTMLLNANDYIKLIENRNLDCVTGELFVYILDETPEKAALIGRVSKELGVAPHTITISNNDNSLPVEKRIIPPVEAWLKCFYDAKFVVTDSYHGCLFSIIFRKPFVAIGNVKRGMSRFQSLLKLLRIEHHLISSVDEYSSKPFYDLPYDIDERIAHLRDDSIEFLHSSLS